MKKTYAIFSMRENPHKNHDHMTIVRAGFETENEAEVFLTKSIYISKELSLMNNQTFFILPVYTEI